MRLYIILILLSLVATCATLSANYPRASSLSNDTSDGESSVEPIVIGNPATGGPSLFSGRTAVYASGAAAITAGLMHFDQQTYSILYRWKEHSAALKTLSPEITNLGTGALSVGLFGGYFGYGFLFDDVAAKDVGKLGLESFALSGIAVQVMKLAFGRERPDVATKAGGKWNGLFAYFRNRSHAKGIASFDSFPSGHTATAFAAATTLSDLYDDPWVSYLSYSVATGVGVSRIMESTHWMSDCFVGGLIGFLSTRAIEKLNALPPSITLEPTELPRSYAVRLAVGI